VTAEALYTSGHIPLVMTSATERGPATPTRGELLHGVRQVEHLISLLRDKLRDLYHRAVLFMKACPQCSRLDLAMVRDSWCLCRSCGHECDPTEAFQECSTCGGRLQRKIHHYWCQTCRHPVRSIYCFDARVFDASYFREMMRESRQRKRDRREQIRKMLADSRSRPLVDLADPNLDGIPGLAEDLAAFIDAPISIPDTLHFGRDAFDLNAYQDHIRQLVAGCVVHFDGIGQLTKNRRLDRAYRFITIIFMAHAGELGLVQESPYAEIILEGRG